MVLILAFWGVLLQLYAFIALPLLVNSLLIIPAHKTTSTADNCWSYVPFSNPDMVCIWILHDTTITDCWCIWIPQLLVVCWKAYRSAVPCRSEWEVAGWQRCPSWRGALTDRSDPNEGVKLTRPRSPWELLWIISSSLTVAGYCSMMAILVDDGCLLVLRRLCFSCTTSLKGLPCTTTITVWNVVSWCFIVGGVLEMSR